MARSPHESSFSFSRRHFQRIVGKVSGEGGRGGGGEGEEEEEILTFSSSSTNSASSSCAGNEEAVLGVPAMAAEKKKKSSSAAAAAAAAVTKFRSVLTAAVTGKNRPSKVTGTLFGHRRGHIHFAFQMDSKSLPTVLIELAMPTSSLVKEMASGLVRIALECERKAYSTAGSGKSKPGKLLEETLWRAYCNGKKCGYAVRRELGPEDWMVLKSVEPVSMGAGVLPAIDGGGAQGEMMYMRAKFERVVGSKDSEAFYMMNPDGNSGPELSIYMLRV